MSDAVLLSRIQFGFSIAFHILFPTLNIGLAMFLIAFEAAWLRTGRTLYLRLYRFWVNVFALGFGIGVVSGVVLSYQIGTNFSRFSAIAGDVVGPLMSYEVLTAFFLEAGFLGIMLFGWGRVGRGVHFAATCLVGLGTVVSAFWIIAANSWMQTPSGFVERDGLFYVADWWRAIFSPSFPYRLTHMLLASLLAVSFALLGTASWYLLRQRHLDIAAPLAKFALGTALVVAPLQVVVGDLSGLEVRDHQPMKLAAIEAIWHTGRDVPLLLFAVPDEDAARNLWELALPHLGSLVLTHSRNGEVKGLDEVPPADRAPVAIVFFTFRFMAGVGFALLFMSWAGGWLWWRGRLLTARPFQWLAVLATPLGFLAVVAGWITAEVGRQPWVVYGLLRTAEGASPVPAGSVAMSLVLFILFYNALLGAFLYYALRLVRQGPAAEVPPGDPGRRPATHQAIHPARPAE
jgi:cytochrome d ubiquinol oxidase subunit I